MIKITPVIKGAKNLAGDLKAENRRQKKALETAIKVEGFRLRRQLQKEIRAGAPGGEEFAPLSMMARKRRRRTKSLVPLAKAVRYHIERDSAGEIQMAIGWTGPQVSKSWKRIAQKQQEGFTVNVSQKQREFLARYGGEIRGKYKPYFFLRRETREMEVPARPIISPFWTAHDEEARRNIAKNFLRKLKGERI
jgi:hypothetical protein